MTTNCDLEEVKHIAQQKFIELVDSGVEWKKNYVTICGNYTTNRTSRLAGYSLGEWWVWTRDNTPTIYLKNEEVWRAYKPYAPEDQEYVFEGPGQCKPKQTKERKAYEKALAAFEADPMVAAIRKIEKVHEDRECEKRRQEMQDALQRSCKALQEALTDTAPTLATQAQKGNTKPYTKPEGHSDSSVRRWWQNWKKARGL